MYKEERGKDLKETSKKFECKLFNPAEFMNTINRLSYEHQSTLYNYARFILYNQEKEKLQKKETFKVLIGGAN